MCALTKQQWEILSLLFRQLKGRYVCPLHELVNLLSRIYEYAKSEGRGLVFLYLELSGLALLSKFNRPITCEQAMAA